MQLMQVGLWSAEEQKVGLEGKMEIVSTGAQILALFGSFESQNISMRKFYYYLHLQAS